MTKKKYSLFVSLFLINRNDFPIEFSFVNETKSSKNFNFADIEDFSIFKGQVYYIDGIIISLLS